MPGPGGDWVTPSAMAFRAAAPRRGGRSVSGKPCPRLTAPVRWASAVISAKIVEVNGRIRGTRKGWRKPQPCHIAEETSQHSKSRSQWRGGATDPGPTDQAARAAPDESR